MIDNLQTGYAFLESQGLNLVGVLDCLALPESVRHPMTEDIDLDAFSRLVVLGNTGERLWDVLEPKVSASSDPIDQHSREVSIVDEPPPPPPPPTIKRKRDQAKEATKITNEGELDDIYEMQQMIDQVDEYYYGVRIFPGQDPAHVWVGWVSPRYHYYAPTFDLSTK